MKWLLSLSVMAVLCVPAWAVPDRTSRPIDVVLCLDTSNSMDGLLISAKMRLWDIVSALAKIKPTPTLRVALYSYGNDTYDKNVGWVRKELDFTNDLDELYRKLNDLTTKGGTELVARVCRDALNDLHWCKDKGALKMLFVCGNEPAGQDPDVRLADVAKLAKDKGVVINGIFCGPASHPEGKDWLEFAQLAGGKFVAIDQDAAAAAKAVKTPHDADLLALNDKLNKTYLPYGNAKTRDNKAENQKVQDSNAAKAGDGVALKRAWAKCSDLYCNSSWDCCDRLKNDPKFDLKSLKEEELCDELRKVKPEEREAYVRKKIAERAEIVEQMSVLNGKRQKLVDAELKLHASAASKALDHAITGILREQAAVKGIEIPE
jgi:hypothetical protein